MDDGGRAPARGSRRRARALRPRRGQRRAQPPSPLPRSAARRPRARPRRCARTCWRRARAIRRTRTCCSASASTTTTSTCCRAPRGSSASSRACPAATARAASPPSRGAARPPRCTGWRPRPSSTRSTPSTKTIRMRRRRRWRACSSAIRGWPLWGLKLAEHLRDRLGAYAESEAVARQVIAGADESAAARSGRGARWPCRGSRSASRSCSTSGPRTRATRCWPIRDGAARQPRPRRAGARLLLGRSLELEGDREGAAAHYRAAVGAATAKAPAREGRARASALPAKEVSGRQRAGPRAARAGERARRGGGRARARGAGRLAAVARGGAAGGRGGAARGTRGGGARARGGRGARGRAALAGGLVAAPARPAGRPRRATGSAPLTYTKRYMRATAAAGSARAAAEAGCAAVPARRPRRESHRPRPRVEKGHRFVDR